MRGVWLRIVPVALLMCATALFLDGRSRGWNLPPHRPLADFPRVIDGWTGDDVAVSAQTREILGPADVLERFYRSDALQPAIELFIAYFPSQRSGDTFHSPKHCLPGSGWTPVNSGEAEVGSLGRRPVSVNRLVIQNGDQSELVLYWYQSHGRVEASDYLARLYLLTDSLRFNRTDGAIVRITSPIGGLSNQLEVTDQRVREFAQAILPLLDQYAPK